MFNQRVVLPPITTIGTGSNKNIIPAPEAYINPKAVTQKYGCTQCGMKAPTVAVGVSVPIIFLVIAAIVVVIYLKKKKKI